MNARLLTAMAAALVLTVPATASSYYNFSLGGPFCSFNWNNYGGQDNFFYNIGFAVPFFAANWSNYEPVAPVYAVPYYPYAPVVVDPVYYLPPPPVFMYNYWGYVPAYYGGWGWPAYPAYYGAPWGPPFGWGWGYGCGWGFSWGWGWGCGDGWGRPYVQNNYYINNYYRGRHHRRAVLESNYLASRAASRYYQQNNIASVRHAAVRDVAARREGVVFRAGRATETRTPTGPASGSPSRTPTERTRAARTIGGEGRVSPSGFADGRRIAPVTVTPGSGGSDRKPDTANPRTLPQRSGAGQRIARPVPLDRDGHPATQPTTQPVIPGRSISSRQPTRSTAPRQPVRAVEGNWRPTTPQQPVRAVTPQQPVRAATPQQPVRAVTPRQPVRAATPQQPVRAATPQQPVRAVQGQWRPTAPQQPVRAAAPQMMRAPRQMAPSAPAMPQGAPQGMPQAGGGMRAMPSGRGRR